MSNSPAELGTQQSSLFPVAIAFLWGPDDLPRSDALATFLNCTALSQETNISVINPEVSRAGLNTPAFFSAKSSPFSRIGAKVNGGIGPSLLDCNQADGALDGPHLTACTEAEVSIVTSFS